MKPRPEQIQHLAEKICADLAAEGVITLKGERSRAVAAVSAAITLDFEREQVLERDAERLLDETVRGMGRAAADIDRRKMLRMIKEKLARERKVIL